MGKYNWNYPTTMWVGENRIDDKTFRKDLNKNIKKVQQSLNRLSKINSKSDGMYKVVSDMFEKSVEIIDNCTLKCDREDLLAVIDSTDFTNAILKDVEKNLIKKNKLRIFIYFFLFIILLYLYNIFFKNIVDEEKIIYIEEITAFRMRHCNNYIQIF